MALDVTAREQSRLARDFLLDAQGLLQCFTSHGLLVVKIHVAGDHYNNGGKANRSILDDLLAVLSGAACEDAK